LTFKDNGTWKFYTKAKPLPITATIPTKHLVMKPITILDWMDLVEVGWGDVDWIGLARDRDRWRTLVNLVLNLRVP
jgi:hypothetical protein